MRLIKVMLLACCLTLLIIMSGCSVFKPVNVTLTPEIGNNDVEYGNNTPSVALTVLDERPTTIIGQRGGNGMGGEVKLQGDLIQLITASIKSGLEDEKVKVLQGNHDEVANLRIEIRSLNYKIITGVWSGTARADSSMKAICTPAIGEPYSRLYRYSYDRKGLQLAPDENEIPRIISKAVSEVINKILNDKELAQCLSN